MWHTLTNRDQQQRDFIITTVPWTDTEIPLMAPAVIKTVVESQGLTCLAVDLNIEVVNYTINHEHRQKFIDFFFDEHLDPVIADLVSEMFESAARGLVSYRPRYIGLSLFSFCCAVSAKWLAYFIRRLDPSIKIIVGGAGCSLAISGSLDYIADLKRCGLIDHHIRGDAEISLAELLKNNTDYPGIDTNSWREMSRQELESLPFADFGDYDFGLYNRKTLPIIGSRGCVRNCTFCDYITNWTKFQWRSAENIFAELMHQVRVYDVTKFKFQDSLVNGNMREFNRLMEMMAEYNEQNPHRPLEWGGFFIFRDPTSNSPQEWETMARAGTKFLDVGIENFNQHIRFAMGKKFKDESIIFHLEQAQRHGIRCSTMMIVGYINERQEDIDRTKDWLRENVRFRDTIQISWGSGLGIRDDTYLGNNKGRLGITMIGSNAHEWISTQTDSTPEIRAAWVRELMDLSKSLGYITQENTFDNHFLIEKMI